MNIQIIIIYALGLCLAIMAAAAEPVNRSSGFDALGRFTVEADIPAGARHAVLEISTEPSGSAHWRPMIAGAIDGRESRVLFRLPPQPGEKLFARIKTGTDTALPPVELSGEDLYYVSYADRVEESARLAFLSAASDKMREWRTLPIAQWQANLVAWALQNPLIASAKAAPVGNDVTLRFRDGTIGTMLYPPRRYTGPSADNAPPRQSALKTIRSSPPADASGAAPRAIVSPGQNLPGSNAAVTAFSLETSFPNSAPTIGGWLSAHQYSVTNFPSTTIDQILGWSAAKPLGVLFWQSHGCPYDKPDGTVGIGLVTRQFVNDALSNGRYAAMIKNGEIGFAIDDNPWKIPYYTVTSEFIRKHVRFAPNSIAVVDACLAGNPELAKGFTDAGCGSFASYDWLSGPQSGTPCLKVFDRLLGMNQEPPISTPRERSFSLTAIRWWMSAYGFDIDPSAMYENQGRPNAKLTWFHHPTTPGYILRPSIMRVLHEHAYPGEPYTKFLIEGDFGDDPGESLRDVTWGGVKMHVVRWEPQAGITIRMPSSPPVGNIEVVMRRNFFTTRSNLVPITEWTVPFTYEVSAEGSKHAKLEMNVKFRADIRGSRGNPEMPVEYLGMLFSNMADCTGTVTASGTHQPYPDTTITWSGGSSLTSVDPNADETYQPRRIRNSGTIEFGNGGITPFELSGDGDFTETEVRTHPDGTTTTYVRKNGLGFPGFYPQPEMPVNWGTGVFRGNTLTWAGGGGSVKLSWPSVTPKMMPDENTER